MNSNLGIYKPRDVSKGQAQMARRTHLQVLVHANDAGRREGEHDRMGHGEPVPELGEERQSHDRRHGDVTIPTHARDCDVPPSSIDETLRKRSPKLRHGVLVLVADDLLKQLPRLVGLWVERRVLLDENHGERDACALPDKVDGVLLERLENLDGLEQARASARNAQSESGAVPNVRVVRLAEELHHARHLRGRPAQDEPQRRDCRSADVVVHIRHGDVEQSADGRVGPRPSVCHGDGVHASVTQKGVLQVLYGLISMYRSTTSKRRDPPYLPSTYR